MNGMRPFLLLGLTGLLAGCTAPRAGEPSYTPLVIRTSDSGTPAVAEKPDGPLALEDCIRIALENSRGLRIARRRVLIAKDRVTEAFAGRLPKVTGEGRYEHRSNRYGMNLGDYTVAIDQRDTASARLTMIVPIYDFEQTARRVDAAERRAEAEAGAAEKARQDLVLDVSRSYFRVLEARRIRTVVDDSLKALESQLRIAQDFLRVGMTARSDMLAVGVQVALRRLDRIQAESNVQLAEATLARVMGVDVDRPPAIADRETAVPWRGPFEAALRLAVERRPDLHALRHRIDAARADYRALANSWMPRIDAFGAYHYSADQILLHNDWLSAGVTVQFPLFDGGATEARRRQAGRLIDESVDVHDARVDDIVLDVKKAWLVARDASEALPVSRLGIALGEENLRMMRDRYAEGMATSADVLVEEERLSRARVGLSRAIYACQVAYATLENAVGGPLPGTDTGQAAPAQEKP